MPSTSKPAASGSKLARVAAPSAAADVERMKNRVYRCDDPTHLDAMAQAREDGLDLSKVIRHYLREYGAAKRAERVRGAKGKRA